jgi:Replication initiation factor
VSQSISDDILEVGIDYITATALVRRSDSGLASFGRFIVGEQVAIGEKSRPWKFSGYRGLTTPHASYGKRQDGEIVRLSNKVASMYWAQATNLSTNVTRLDVAVTVRSGLGPKNTLRRHHRELLTLNKRRGRPLTFKAWYGPRGCESLMIGSRASDQCMRVYDKYAESGTPEYKDCVRYEVELKRDPAAHYAQQFDALECPERQMAHLVHSFASVRRLCPGWSVRSLTDATISTFQCWRDPHPVASSLNKRLSYATFSTSKLVKDCLAAGRLDDYIAAVGLSELVTRRVGPLGSKSVLVSEEVH